MGSGIRTHDLLDENQVRLTNCSIPTYNSFFKDQLINIYYNQVTNILYTIFKNSEQLFAKIFGPNGICTHVRIVLHVHSRMLSHLIHKHISK